MAGDSQLRLVAAPPVAAPDSAMVETTASARRLLSEWRYGEGSSRDLRLDLLRGYCVFAMIVDHLDAPTWLHAFTGGNRFVVSAAEGFVFVSGVVMGIVYRPLTEKAGFTAAATKALRRALFLFAVTVAATLGFMWLSARLGLPWSAGIDLTAAAPRVLTLRQTFYLTDVLMLYTVVVALAPLAIWLLHRRAVLALMVVVWGIWGAHQVNPIDLPWPSEEGAFFYVAAWQVLFFTGLAFGWHRKDLARRAHVFFTWPFLALSALGIALFYAIWRLGWGWAMLGRYVPDAAATVATAFAKWNLPPARLLACATVFVFAFLVAHHAWRPLRATVGHVLLPLGQSALSAYVIHLVVIALLTAWRQDGAGRQVNLALGGTALQLAAVGATWCLVIVWTALHRGLGHVASQGRVLRRLEPALAAAFALSLTAAIVLAPLPAAPVAGLVPLRSDRASIEQPHYSLRVPPSAAAQQPLQVVVVLHDRDENPEQFGQELVELADRAGWLLVAPHLTYQADVLDPGTVAAEAPALMRGLHDVITELPAATGLRLRRRTILFGYGRGASLAERYAISHAPEVRAVALLGGGGYTLPPLGDEADDPPFPFGAKGLAQRVGRPIDREALKRVRFWLGVGERDVDTTQTSRAWDPYLGATRLERARTLAAALRQGGASVELEVFPGAGHEMTAEMREAVDRFIARARNVEPLLPPRLPPGG